MQYTLISCITSQANEPIEHTFISFQFNKQVYCFVYFQAVNSAMSLILPLLKLTGVEHRITGAYHLQANGLVEKQNSMTTIALKECLNQQEDWCRALDPIAFSFRGSKHCSTGRTPFEIMFGVQMLLPVELCTRQLLL